MYARRDSHKIRGIDSSSNHQTMKTYFSKLIAVTALGMVLLTACDYDVKELGPKPVASFTVTPIAGQTNKYLLTSTSTNAFRFDWDKADGSGFLRGKAVDTVYFPDKGTYNV